MAAKSGSKTASSRSRTNGAHTSKTNTSKSNASKSTTLKKSTSKNTASKSTASRTSSSKAGTSRSGATRAASGGKTTVRKPASAPKRSSAPKQQGDSLLSNAIARDVAFVLFFAVTIMLMISNFGYGGNFGTRITDYLFGLFGAVQFILPVLLLLLVLFIFANRGNHYLFRKVFGCLGLAWFFMAFCGLMTSGFYYDDRLIDYFRDSRYDHLGAGFVGGILIRAFSQFGLICTWIFVIVGIMIFVIIATQKPFIGTLLNLDTPDLFGGRIEAFFAMLGAAFVGAFASIANACKVFLGMLPSVSLPKFSDEDDDEYDDDEFDEDEEEEKPKRSGRKHASDTKKPSSDKAEAADQKPSRAKDAYDEISFPLDFDDADEDSRKIEEDLSKKPLVIDHFDFDSEEDMDENEDLHENKDFFQSVPAPVKKEVSSDGSDFGFDDLALDDVDTGLGHSTKQTHSILDEDDDEDDDFSWLDDNGDLKKNDLSQDFNHPGAESDAAVSGKARKQRVYTDRKELEAEASQINQMQKTAEKKTKPYVFPKINLLTKGPKRKSRGNDAELMETVAQLQETFDSFGVNVDVLEDEVACGPTVTQFQIKPGPGVKVSRIVSLADDIKLALGTADIRFEAPIPGKNVVGIEVPNSTNQAVYLRDLIETDQFANMKSKLAFGLGMNISGEPVIADIAKMPHLLIAGATGSGKSVCINTLIMSLLYKANPDEVKLIMIDPKVVELSVYNGIPHLLIPVVTDPKKASGALNWAVQEMTKRYNAFAEFHVRDMKGYNAKVKEIPADEKGYKPEPFPQIVIIVDELADLMMVAPGEVEESICRLAQLARAAGIHLIIATQRPSVNVITGLIKANMPTRIAFSVSSGVDSRTILDMVGAEKLLGKGDMLYKPQNLQKPVRLQGSFVSDEEVEEVVNFLKQQCKTVLPLSDGRDIEKEVAQASLSTGAKASELGGNEQDALFAEAGRFIIEKDKASIGMLQRVFKIGFNRAARIMDQLADAGVVGPEEGTKPRKILMSPEQFENYIEEH